MKRSRQHSKKNFFEIPLALWGAFLIIFIVILTVTIAVSIHKSPRASDSEPSPLLFPPADFRGPARPPEIQEPPGPPPSY